MRKNIDRLLLPYTNNKNQKSTKFISPLIRHVNIPLSKNNKRYSISNTESNIEKSQNKNNKITKKAFENSEQSNNNSLLSPKEEFVDSILCSKGTFKNAYIGYSTRNYTRLSKSSKILNRFSPLNLKQTKFACVSINPTKIKNIKKNENKNETSIYKTIIISKSKNEFNNSKDNSLIKNFDSKNKNTNINKIGIKSNKKFKLFLKDKKFDNNNKDTFGLVSKNIIRKFSNRIYTQPNLQKRIFSCKINKNLKYYKNDDKNERFAKRYKKEKKIFKNILFDENIEFSKKKNILENFIKNFKDNNFLTNLYNSKEYL